MLSAAIAKPAVAATASAAKPNILIITIDTWRWDRAGFANPSCKATPNMDVLAGESWVFTRAFAHNPVTLASHCNIMTGMTPLYHGISDNTGFRLDERHLTLARHLKANGYATAAFVASFPLDSRFGLDQGFDLYDDNCGTHNQMDFFYAERPAERVIAPAVEWIRRQKQPWFAWVHLFDPHQPYLPPMPWRQRYADDLYTGEVAYVDSQLGVLFAALRGNGVMDKTVVVLTADHGEALGEKGEETHSYFAYNNTIHVPLCLRIPGQKPLRFSGNVCHIDIFPSVCRALGVPTPGFLQGEALQTIVAAGKRRRSDIYFESLTAFLNRGWAPLRGMVRDNTKFIDLPIKEVYDLGRDMGESSNIAKTSDIGRLKNGLLQLQRTLQQGAAPVGRGAADAETMRQLRSLGYMSSGSAAPVKRSFTAADDLKTLLPLQNKLWEAVAQFNQGETAAAEEKMLQVVAASPEYTLAYNSLSTLYAETGQPEKARRILEQGLRKNPEDVSLLSRLGILLAESGSPQRAVEVLNVCTRKAPHDPDHFNYLGIAHFRIGNAAKALESYRTALKLDANNASVFNNIGTLYLSLYLQSGKNEDFRAAESNLQRAVAVDPRQFNALNGLGGLYKKSGRLNDAERCWRKALEAKPDFSMPMFNLGVLLLERGEHGQALELFSRFQERFANRLSEAERRSLQRLMAEARRQQPAAAVAK